MRMLKAVAFCLLFCALCAGAVLGAMRIMSRGEGAPGRYDEWMGEIRGAFREARDFISEHCGNNRSD